MKPVQKSIKEAGSAIAASPWTPLMNSVRDISNGVSPNSSQLLSNHNSNLSTNSNFSTATTLTTSSSFPPPGPPIPNLLSSQFNSPYSAYGPPSASTASFGFPTPVPATPLSAALGPAAFATVPSTPGQSSTRNGSDSTLLAGNPTANGTHAHSALVNVESLVPVPAQPQLNWLARADALLQQQGSTIRRVER